ncbi:hypothetical protein ACFV9E_17665 [Streptomyces sp. NPDC059835]|uniref:hypothetical protein n=1 Tax=Streptomyces sp. NPDC059835 TaxID=3346967 RepID=UPI00365350CC
MIPARLASPDPRVRETAARAVTAVVREPEAERELASALVAAAVREDDHEALAALFDALPCVEPALDDRELDRLASLRTDSPVLSRLLERAARVQVHGPPEPDGDVTKVVVRCLRGARASGRPCARPVRRGCGSSASTSA